MFKGSDAEGWRLNGQKGYKGADAVNIIEGIKAIDRIEGIDMGTRGAIASNNFCYRPMYACMYNRGGS